MNLQEKKLELVQLILYTEKPSVLKKEGNRKRYC